MTFDELFDIKDQIILVTGAASGIGLAYSEILAERGARVIMADIDMQAAEREASRLTAQGYLVEGRRLDVTEGDDIAGVVADIVEAHGRIDTLFANAGIGGGPGFSRAGGGVEDADIAHFDKVVAINLRSVFLSIRAVAATMKARGRGRIIVTGSFAGLRASPGMSYSYVATKAAVTNMVRQAALEFAPYGVLVNGIAPGPISTNIGGGRLKNDAGVRDQNIKLIPLGRIGEPDDLKGVALLLASPASGFMTGALISVDGGKSAT
jgi:NAD(P)-dependent dehydrogenase (short-subunit alcohol dehydrogenase family)